MQNYYQKEPNESKRISWLSIFSSLMENSTDAINNRNEAYRINDELYEKYPFPKESELPSQKIMNQQAKEVCPKCGSEMKEKSGVKNGRKWAGAFCQNKECKHVIWYPKQTRQQTERSMNEDRNWDEASHNPPLEYGG
jgi:ssDNA-binding Zn-finger/Zn-ribbon topoisomerase 1